LAPGVFDANTGLLAVTVTKGNGGGSDFDDSCTHVGRGVVLYGGGRMIGALARDPIQPLNAQLVLYNAAAAFGVLGDGYSGAIRVSGFYQVGGAVGQTGTVTIGSTTLTITGGIITGVVGLGADVSVSPAGAPLPDSVRA